MSASNTSVSLALGPLPHSRWAFNEMCERKEHRKESVLGEKVCPTQVLMEVFIEQQPSTTESQHWCRTTNQKVQVSASSNTKGQSLGIIIIFLKKHKLKLIQGIISIINDTLVLSHSNVFLNASGRSEIKKHVRNCI